MATSPRDTVILVTFSMSNLVTAQNMKRIVIIGGGTGTYTVLSGLKKHENLNLSAVVSSMDDGGSNKKFRDEFGLLPPSDFAQCLVALSHDGPQHAITLRKLMNYRFSKGVGLEGQRFSNILIAALTDIEGSQIRALETTGAILNIKGDILPITTDDVRLMAEYENGDLVMGEHLIDEPEEFHDARMRIKRLFLNRKANLYPPTRKAIKLADYIILGPGDLYTSTIANLIVGDTPDVIKNSSAKVIYLPNLMTKYGQTYKFSAKDHVLEIKKYLGREPDYILINNKPLPTNAIKRYAKEKNDYPVKDDLATNTKNIIRKDLLSRKIIKKNDADKLYRSLIRHDISKLGKALFEIITSDRNI